MATGNLEQVQFDALLLELQQSLLVDVNNDAEEQAALQKVTLSHGARKFDFTSIAVPVVLAFLIPLLAYSLYYKWGYLNDVELMDLFQRTVDNSDDAQEAQNLIVSLGEIVQADDDKPWAWYFLAENFANLGMFNEAEIAYLQSANRMQDTPEKALVLGRVALARYINAELALTPEVQEIVDQARAINPNEISILQLLAADAEQRADYRSAIEYWRLMIQANPNSEQAQMLRSSITAAQQLLATADPAVSSGPGIDVSIALAEGIELDKNLRVFVAVRNAERQGTPPLAATDLTVANLPTTIRLDNSDAVGAFNLSSADTVYVSVLVSFTGSANPQSGDYRVVSPNFAHNEQHAVIELLIGERIP